MPEPLEVLPSREREEGENGAARRDTGRWDDLWVILGSSLYLFASLFTFRGTPFLLGGDQVYFWLYAQRMIDGQIIFRDFLQFTPPGTDLVFAGAFEIFGQHIWVVNLVALVLGVALTWLCFRIGRAFLSRREAMLAAGLLVVLIYGKILIATHHWFSAFAVLSAVAMLMRGRKPTRIAMARMLLGLATFFTQTRGLAAFACIALYLERERAQENQTWREFCNRIALLSGGFVITCFVLDGYFIATAGLDRMGYWLVTYLVRYHASGVNTLGLLRTSRGDTLRASPRCWEST